MAEWEKVTIRGQPNLVLTIPGVGRATVKSLGEGEGYLYQTSLLLEEGSTVTEGPGGVEPSLRRAMERAEKALTDEAGSYGSIEGM